MRKLIQNDLEKIIGAKNQEYTILKARIKEGVYSDSDHYGIVLAESEHMYVTWEFNLQSDETPAYYWGHYFDKKYSSNAYEKALEDYNKRD